MAQTIIFNKHDRWDLYVRMEEDAMDLVSEGEMQQEIETKESQGWVALRSDATPDVLELFKD